MTLETAIQNLADAINSLVNAAIILGPQDAPPNADAPTAKRGPGRPRKNPEPPPAVEPDPELPPQAVEAAKRADIIEAAVEAPTKDQVRAALIEVVKRVDKGTAAGLCEKYGAPMLSGVAESDYGALMADCQRVLHNLEPA
jgi:hypothetical protein